MRGGRKNDRKRKIDWVDKKRNAQTRIGDRKLCCTKEEAEQALKGGAE